MFRMTSVIPHLHMGLAVALRATTLAGRFGLTMALAAIASTEVVGSFGLYSSAIILSYSMMGMDVYAATTRELLVVEADDRPLRKHFGFLILSYLLFLPFVALASSRTDAANGLILLLFVIHLAFEYYCQEFVRLIVVIGMPLASTVILFVRTTLWIPAAVGLIWRYPALDPMLVLALSWLGGSILSAFIISHLLSKEKKRSIAPIFDFDWIRGTIKASFVFFIGTLLFRIMLNGDRFVVNEFLPRSMLGVYTVYTSVAMGLLALAETGVSAWLYPGLVSNIQRGNLPQVRRLLATFRNRMVIGSILGGGALALVIPVLLAWIGKAEYLEYVEAYYLILIGASLYCMSMPYHYVIYGFRRDRIFIGIYVAALLIMLAVGLIIIPRYGLYGACAMLAAALFFIAIARYFAANKLLAKMDLTASPENL